MELGGKGAVTAHKALRTAEKLRTMLPKRRIRRFFTHYTGNTQSF